MIAKRSELVLKKFVIVDSKLSIVIPENQTNFNLIEATDESSVSINFDFEKKNDEEIYRTIVTININADEEKRPGYSISVTGIGFFTFLPDLIINDKEKQDLLRISGLSICITNIRLFIMNQTSYYLGGSFSFHAVDILSLLKEKIKEESKESEVILEN